MCKYCEHPKEPIKDQEWNYNVMIWLSEETEIRYYDSGWQSVTVPFKFCPICARRLKEETDGGDLRRRFKEETDEADLSLTNQNRDIMTIVGSNVKKYREEAGFTESYLGSCFGARSNRIKMIEGGMADFKLSTLAKLAEYLGVKVIDLVEDWEDENEDVH